MMQQMLKFPLSAGTGRCFELHCPPDLSMGEIKKAQEVINLFFEMHEPETTSVEQVESTQIHSDIKQEEKPTTLQTEKKPVETKQKKNRTAVNGYRISKDSGRMSQGLREAIKEWLKFIGKSQASLIKLVAAKQHREQRKIEWMFWNQTNVPADVISIIKNITGIEAVLEEQIDGKMLWICSESTPENFTAEVEAEPDEEKDEPHGDAEAEEDTLGDAETFTGGGAYSQGDEPESGMSEQAQTEVITNANKISNTIMRIRYCVDHKTIKEEIPRCDQTGVIRYLKEKKKELTKELGYEPVIVLFGDGVSHTLNLAI